MLGAEDTGAQRQRTPCSRGGDGLQSAPQQALNYAVTLLWWEGLGTVTETGLHRLKAGDEQMSPRPLTGRAFWQRGPAVGRLQLEKTGLA